MIAAAGRPIRSLPFELPRDLRLPSDIGGSGGGEPGLSRPAALLAGGSGHRRAELLRQRREPTRRSNASARRILLRMRLTDFR